MFITPTAVFLTVCLAQAAFASRSQHARLAKRGGMAQVFTSCTVPNTVALTFDDGPYIYTPEIIEALDAAGAKGTFFVNGENWSCIYNDDNVESIRQAHVGGHQIASHTWAHLDLALLNQTTLESEMDRVNLALKRIIGSKPAFLRPPFGSYNDLVRTVAASRSLTIANWDFDSGDTKGYTADGIKQAYSDLANQHPATILSLHHDTRQVSAQVLPAVLDALKAKGYNKFVTVAECLGMNPYQDVGSPQTKDDSWACGPIDPNHPEEPTQEPTSPQGMANVVTECTVPNTVALTFDDGPYIYQPAIINALEAAGAKATFFVNGENWDCIYSDQNIQSLKNAYDKGHQIASHTWAHLDLAQQTSQIMHSEMDKVNEAIERITGATPAFIRPPFGSYNDQVRTVAGSKNLTLVTWDFDSTDSWGSSAEQIKQSYNDIASQHPSSILTLNHETAQPTGEQVLPYVLQTLKAKGYKFVTVAECLGMSPYKKIGSPKTKDSTWACWV